MTPLILDVETTIFQKGHAFAARNKLCYVGTYSEGSSVFVGTPTILPDIGRQIVSASEVVGFNIKFDLHWLRREGIGIGNRRVWDCQYAHFLLSGQREKYPSLDGVLNHYGLPPKMHVVEEEYWSKGIDTPNIPPEIMLEYLATDLERTYQVYVKQKEDFGKNPRLYSLFRLACADLLVLAEMEYNGLILDLDETLKKKLETIESLKKIEEQLNQLYPHITINWNSGDDVSCVLYGGTITREFRDIAGIYKTGEKTGQPRYSIRKEEYKLEQLVKPLKGSELKKAGYWSTDEATLKQLKGKKKIITLLLDRSTLSKELDYYEGIPKLYIEKDWSNSIIHGQFNQCVASTGRLSASAPNQQNFSEGIKGCIVSRYAF